MPRRKGKVVYRKNRRRETPAAVERYILVPGDPGYATFITPTYKPSKGSVNKLSLDDIDMIVSYWLEQGTICVDPDDGRWWCDLATTGKYKHAQATIPTTMRPHLSFNSSSDQFKVLVHQVVWRFNTRFALPTHRDMPISHTGRNSQYLDVIAESVALNESRKACHSFKWYESGLCPHRYRPCTK
jgi:hypothetical protein